MYDVFISYSRKDTQVIDRIEKELCKYGITMFIDRAGIDAGTDWAETIAQALYESEIVLFVWSENSNTSENTANEIALAIDYQKTIIPFKIGDFKADFKLSYRLVRFNRIDALPYNEGKVVELGAKIAKVLGKTMVQPKPGAVPERPATAPDAPPQEDKRMELLYHTGREALLAFRLADAFKDLMEPALNDYKDARFLMADIVGSQRRITHIPKESFDPARHAAEEGNGFALYMLAREAGFLEQDHELQFSFARMSADMGDSYGLFEVSECYDKGFGVKKDTAVGEQYRQDSVRKNNWLATMLHARNLLYGWTIKKNPQKGITLIKMLVDKGMPEAYYRLAYAYESGDGVQKDREKAIELYEKAVEHGYMEGYSSLGQLYIYNEKGEICSPDMVKKGYDYLMKGSRLNETDSLSSLALGYYTGSFVKQDYAQALRWYKKAAEYGDTFSLYMISDMYYCGTGVEENNDEAWRWAQKGVALSTSNCLYMAGRICQDGYAPEDVEQSQCIRYYDEAADLGGWGAEYALLKLYEIFRTDRYKLYQLNDYQAYDWAEKDEARAVTALRRAADYGNADAQYLLGVYLTDLDNDYADEFHGLDMLEQAAPQQPMAYIRLAMLSVKGAVRPFDEDEIRRYLSEAQDAGVEQKFIDFVTASMYLERLGDSDVTAQNRRDYDRVIDLLRKHVHDWLIDGYWPYTNALVRLIAGTQERQYAELLYKVAKQYSDEGYIQGYIDLAMCYSYGFSVGRDMNRAMELYRKAAEAGSDYGAYYLGKLYYDQRNMQQAKYWLRKALELGYDRQRVQEYLDKIG